MLIGISLSIILMLVIFSLVLDTEIVGIITEIGVDNTSLVDGVPITYLVESQDLLFSIDTSSLITSGIAIIITIIVVATITGIQVLGSGLSPASVRIFILLTGFVGIWTSLSILAFSLIVSIEIFGGIIYIIITVAYTIGVIQKITGS